MAKNIQKVLGRDNVQVHIGNLYYEIKDVYKGIDVFFKGYDEEINKYFPDKIEDSKLRDVRGEFESSKILSSLVKVGIPFENALNIVYHVISMILNDCKQNKYTDGLSTHKIRKIVADTIIKYPIEDTSYEEIEKWADKYVRAYGRDGQRIEVYFNDSDNILQVDYNFLKKRLLPDIISDLGIRNEVYRQEISSNQLNSISEEIIQFLNNCNMYKINYEILKNFITEMSLQPPHPWFVTNETRKEICQYDLNILEKYYKTLCDVVKEENYEDVYYVICEALHHSCSSILARYNEVLGCKDLDAFYHLENIVTELNSRDEQNLLIENYAISTLPTDLKYISIELSYFLDLLRKIKSKLMVGKSKIIFQKEVIEKVIELCEIAQNLDNNIDKEDVEKFLHSEWKDISYEKTMSYVKKMFEVIDGIKIIDVPNCLDCFWINRKYTQKDKCIFTICITNHIESENIIKFMNKRKTRLNTSGILLIIEHIEDKNKYDYLQDALEDDNYCIDIMYKSDLQKIFESNNKYNEFQKILNRGLYL